MLGLHLLGIPAGLVTANAVEWLIHKYILHGLGRRRSSYWAFHFHEHHGNVRRNGYRDPAYERSPLGLNAQGKEVWGLLGLAAAFAPLLPVAPLFVVTLWYCAANYYYVHKRSHLEPDWGKRRLRWHYDHHMGSNPSANWCVTRPWFDYVMGTREFTDETAHESNVLGLDWLPRWLERGLPAPGRLARLQRGPRAGTAAETPSPGSSA